MTNTLELAHHILKIALSCGYRESGIMNPALPTTLAIRTTGISFDCIIGHYDASSRKVCQTVDDAYLGMLVSVANSRFNENEKRRDSFSRAMLSLLDEAVNNNLVSHPELEDSETRKKRMKSEGLQRRSKLKELEISQNQGSLPGTLEEEEPFGFEQLALDQGDIVQA